ncbi:MAG: 50S ribosomal protein L31 [Anaerolineales bacterium]|nr:50S ribosomal protein L31 [Anaerolineales bacterium]
MREGIHPKWYPDAKMICLSCGTEWTMGATVQERRLDICSNCHPFYTGEQRIVDTEGQVDRFYKRLKQRDELVASLTKDEEPLPIEASVHDLELGSRYTQILQDNGYNTIGAVFNLLNEKGDDGLLSMSGIGRKVLADVKRKLRSFGFELASQGDEAE